MQPWDIWLSETHLGTLLCPALGTRGPPGTDPPPLPGWPSPEGQPVGSGVPVHLWGLWARCL